MWKPLTLSQIFGQSLWPFFSNPFPTISSADANCEKPLFLVFQAYIKFFLTNPFDMITNAISIKQYVFHQYLSHYLQDSLPPPKKKRMKKHIGRRWVRQIYPPLTKILRNRPSLTFPLNSISVSPLFCYAHYVKMIF